MAKAAGSAVAAAGAGGLALFLFYDLVCYYRHENNADDSSDNDSG